MDIRLLVCTATLALSAPFAASAAILDAFDVEQAAGDDPIQGGVVQNTSQETAGPAGDRIFTVSDNSGNTTLLGTLLESGPNTLPTSSTLTFNNNTGVQGTASIEWLVGITGVNLTGTAALTLDVLSIDVGSVDLDLLIGTAGGDLALGTKTVNAGETGTLSWMLGNSDISSVNSILLTFNANTPDVDAVFDTFATTPVPLPAAGWMLIAGIGGIAAMKRRKKS